MVINEVVGERHGCAYEDNKAGAVGRGEVRRALRGPLGAEPFFNNTTAPATGSSGGWSRDGARLRDSQAVPKAEGFHLSGPVPANVVQLHRLEMRDRRPSYPLRRRRNAGPHIGDA